MINGLLFFGIWIYVKFFHVIEYQCYVLAVKNYTCPTFVQWASKTVETLDENSAKC